MVRIGENSGLLNYLIIPREYLCVLGYLLLALLLHHYQVLVVGLNLLLWKYFS